MADEINFLDLAVLIRITPNTPLEKLGGLINSSIFDASNIAGTLKQKSLIEFSANYPGPNSMNVTEQGNMLIREANERSADSFDKLDEVILQHLSGGKRFPSELQTTLNLRPKDLAIRLYKESKQGYITYDIKNGNVELILTEKGFLKAKNDREGMIGGSTMGTMPPTFAQNRPSGVTIQQQSATPQIQQTQPQSIAQTQTIQNSTTQNTNGIFKELNFGNEQDTTINTHETPQLKNENKRWMTIAILLVILVVVYVLVTYVL